MRILRSALAASLIPLACAASADAYTQTASCDFPLVGAVPVEISSQADLPATWPARTLLPGATVRVSLNAPGLKLRISSATIGQSLAISTPTGTLDVNAPAQAGAGDFSAGPVTATGAIPAFVLPAVPATLSVRNVKLVLRPVDASGQPIPFPGPDEDGDPTTVAVACTWGGAPAPQLARIDAPAPRLTPPGAPVPSDVTATSTRLTWTPSTGGQVARYVVKVDGVQRAETTATSVVVDGLNPGTTHTAQVAAEDPDGQRSDFSPETAWKTLAQASTRDVAFDVRATADFTSLTRSPVALTGALTGRLTTPGGEFTGALALNRVRTRLRAFGSIPVTADLDLVATAPATGTLPERLVVRFKTRVAKLYLFGSIPVAGGESCQTKTASTAQLERDGSRLAGEFAMTDLTGCGPLNAFLSPLTRSTGNRLELALSERPA